MPVRNNSGERTEEIWERIVENIAERGTGDFIINGDFNAETEAWIDKTGRTPEEEDMIYQGITEDLKLIASITEDYTFERAQTQIDNILVTIGLVLTLTEARVTAGVREKDHKMVIAALAWGIKGGKVIQGAGLCTPLDYKA
eukprot:1439726-Pleurochrysis_carterae.AAC.3